MSTEMNEAPLRGPRQEEKKEEEKKKLFAYLSLDYFISKMLSVFCLTMKL
jgi:hypothetical protein